MNQADDCKTGDACQNKQLPIFSQKDKGCWAMNYTHGRRSVPSMTQNTDFYRDAVLAVLH